LARAGVVVVSHILETSPRGLLLLILGSHDDGLKVYLHTQKRGKTIIINHYYAGR
jgi:hypothetical protein